MTKTRAKLYKMLRYLHNLMSVKPVKHVSVSNHDIMVTTTNTTTTTTTITTTNNNNNNKLYYCV